MKKLGFTLIELLVVIVIIGILATITTATFSGYIEKSRDTERQVNVQSVARIVIASQLDEDTKDYRLGTSNSVLRKDALINLLEESGSGLPEVKNDIIYRYLISGGVPATEFVFFACKEESLGIAQSEVSDIVFVAGDYEDLDDIFENGANDGGDAAEVCGGPGNGETETGQPSTNPYPFSSEETMLY